MATMTDFTDKWVHPKPTNGCADCMFTCFSWGTYKCFPTSFGFRFVIGEDGIMSGVDNYYCFCLKPSPIPCFMCCGVGPCAQVPKFKKESDTKYVGTGDSQMAGGCCKAMMHNEGDVITVHQGDVPKLVFTAGKSPFYPPCFHGKDVMEVTLPKGGSPQVAQMER